MHLDSVTLAHHLHTAARAYESSEQALSEVKGSERLQRDMREQKEQCTAFAEALEQGSMRVDGDLLIVRS